MSAPISSMSPVAREYVRRFVSNILGYAVSEWSEADGILAELARQPELETGLRDRWGNWEWPYGDSQRRGQLYIPWLDQSIIARREQMAAPNRPPEPRWPEGKRFALCLTHDVDYVSLYRTAQTLFRNASRALQSGRGPLKAAERMVSDLYHWLTRPSGADPLWRYEEWLKLEEHFGFKSTFFVFPSQPGRPHSYDCVYTLDDCVRYEGRKLPVRDMLQEIGQAGWEIGLHGSFRSATDPDLLKDEREQIEDSIARPVASIRQHWLHYDARLTPALQAAAGLKADSTQGFNRAIGFRAGTAFPYWCWDHVAGQPSAVLEIPLHIMDGALFSIGALEYNEELAIAHSRQLMDAVERVGGVLTLNWHAHGINTPAWWRVYERLLSQASSRGAWGCSAAQLYHWWVEREKRIQSTLTPGR